MYRLNDKTIKDDDDLNNEAIKGAGGVNDEETKGASGLTPLNDMEDLMKTLDKPQVYIKGSNQSTRFLDYDIPGTSVTKGSGRRRPVRDDVNATRMKSGVQKYQARKTPPPSDAKSRRRSTMDSFISTLSKYDDARTESVANQTPKRSGQYAAECEVIDKENKIVVAAIDFGTTYSGYAFSFKHDYAENPLKMHTNNWTNVAQGNMNVKTPTCLLLDPNRKLHSFGGEAKDKYLSLSEDDEHKDWYFFWQFKMTLHQEKEIKGNYKLTEENGKELDALTVFSLSIKALKNHVMKALENGYTGIRGGDVMWVITVPAIWNDSAKKFMRLAAEEAGIQKDSIDIALEPEAASIFCRQSPITRDPQTETGMTKFPIGTRYMILDCGGGTVDVTVHEIVEGNNLKELHKATGGEWGGNVVNKAFLSFVSNLVGSDVYDDFSEKHKCDYLEMLEEFENKKRKTSADSKERVTIRIPITLHDASNRNLRKQVEQGEYKNRMTITGDKLRMDADIFKTFFQQAVSAITEHVGNLMESLPSPIKAILMVGGFSESPILQRAIKDSFEGKVEVIVPVEASLCVMKGAVLYGHQPSKITERKSRYTYGVAMTVPFIPRLHPEKRKVISDGQEVCDNVFDIHVEINHTVKTGEAQAKRKYYPDSASDTFFPVYIFRSTDRYPKFVDEESCDFVGMFRVKRDPEFGKTTHKDAVEVRLIFGGSDIKVEAFKSDGSVHSAEFALNA